MTIDAIRKYSQPWSKNIFLLFCVFFGYTFIIAQEGGADSDRYARQFISYAYSDLNIKELWQSFYAEGSNIVDIASPLLSYILSRFTNNPRILFAFYGLIFGFFYSRNIWYVLNRTKGANSLVTVMFILAFALINPIWNINGFRFNVAAQIFLYGALPFMFEKRTKGLLWAASSLLFHFSFMLPVAALFIYNLLRNKINIYYSLFIITSFAKEIDLLEIRSILFFLPDIFHTKVTSYTNPQVAEAMALADADLNWYITYSQIGLKWVLYAMATFLFFFGRSVLRFKPDVFSAFCFALLIYSAANIASLVPVGGRFIPVANTVMLPVFIIFFMSAKGLKGLTFMKVFSIPVLLLFCLVAMRTGMDYYGIITLIGNPIAAGFINDFTPLIQLLK